MATSNEQPPTFAEIVDGQFPSDNTEEQIKRAMSDTDVMQLVEDMVRPADETSLTKGQFLKLLEEKYGLSLTEAVVIFDKVLESQGITNGKA
jgi:hypothetical protein